MILGRAPLRISFSGGGTDLEEYHSRFGGCAISHTINKYTYVIVKLRHDDKLQGFSPDFASIFLGSVDWSDLPSFDMTNNVNSEG